MSTMPRYDQNLCYSTNSWTDMTLVHSRTPLAQEKGYQQVSLPICCIHL